MRYQGNLTKFRFPGQHKKKGICNNRISFTSTRRIIVSKSLLGLPLNNSLVDLFWLHIVVSLVLNIP